MRKSRGCAFVWVVACVVLAACGGEATPDYRSAERSYAETYLAGGGDSEEARAYVRGLLADDPERETIADAWMHGDSLLGLVVRDRVEGAELRELLILLARDVASEFAGRDIEVVAYDERSRDAVARATYMADSATVPYESTR